MYFQTMPQSHSSELIDSLQVVQLDSIRQAKYQDSLIKAMKYPEFKLADAFKLIPSSPQEIAYQAGKPKYQGESWLLIPILLVILVFALLKQVFDKQLGTIFQAFFNNRVLSNLNKEDNLFGSWPFVLLFVLFGFSLGLFLYQAAVLQGYSFQMTGPEAFLTVSAVLILLFVFKLLALRFLGFFFQVQKATVEYIFILSITYFNVAMVFLPMSICLALAPDALKPFLVLTGLIILLLSFGLQAIRAAYNILSQNRFSKVYLLLYFCTLEICPILILIRAMGY